MSDAQEEDFQKTAEAFAASVPVPEADQVAKRRGELHGALLAAVHEAAQARADIQRAGKQGSDSFGAAVNFRQKEHTATNALAALIEFEAGQL